MIGLMISSYPRGYTSPLHVVVDLGRYLDQSDWFLRSLIHVLPSSSLSLVIPHLLPHVVGSMLMQLLSCV